MIVTSFNNFTMQIMYLIDKTVNLSLCNIKLIYKSHLFIQWITLMIQESNIPYLQSSSPIPILSNI